MKLSDLASRQNRFTPRNWIGGLQTFIKRKISRRNTRTLLAAVERHQGPLPASLKRQCDDYAREVFGSDRYVLPLYVYAALQRVFKEGWIPFNYYAEHVVPANYLGGTLCQERHLTRRFVNPDQVPDVAFLLGGKLYDPQFQPLTLPQAANVIFDQRDQVLFKRNRSARGLGICRVTRQELLAAPLPRIPDGVFQRIVTPHAAFDDLLPEQGPTIRILTVRDPAGKVAVRVSNLKVALKDIEFVKGKEFINIPIDIATGRLREFGYAVADYQPLVSHPDTGLVFAGYELPMFRETAAAMVKHHESFPLSGIIGWDVCIDRDGRPQVFEWNLWRSGIRSSESVSGPHFRGLGWENLWKNKPH